MSDKPHYIHVELIVKGWKKASWQECCLGSQTVSSGFSTFSVITSMGSWHAHGSSRYARTISRHADGISRYSIPASAGPLLPL